MKLKFNRRYHSKLERLVTPIAMDNDLKDGNRAITESEANILEKYVDESLSENKVKRIG